MKIYSGYEETKAATGDYEVLALGGHPCVVRTVKCEDKQYGELLTIEFDISAGENAGYYKRLHERFGKWQGKYYQTILDANLSFFKGFIRAIEESNDGFKWDANNPDEQKLVGKLFGGVFGNEEYLNKNNEIKVSTKCVQIRSLEAIKKGVNIPAIKRVNTDKLIASNFTPVAAYDDELPF